MNIVVLVNESSGVTNPSITAHLALRGNRDFASSPDCVTGFLGELDQLLPLSKTREGMRFLQGHTEQI